MKDELKEELKKHEPPFRFAASGHIDKNGDLKLEHVGVDFGSGKAHVCGRVVREHSDENGNRVIDELELDSVSLDGTHWEDIIPPVKLGPCDLSVIGQAPRASMSGHVVEVKMEEIRRSFEDLGPEHVGERPRAPGWE